MRDAIDALKKAVPVDAWRGWERIVAKVVKVGVRRFVDIFIELLRSGCDLNSLDKCVHPSSGWTFPHIRGSKDTQHPVGLGVCSLLGVPHIKVVLQEVLVESSRWYWRITCFGHDNSGLKLQCIKVWKFWYCFWTKLKRMTYLRLMWCLIDRLVFTDVGIFWRSLIDIGIVRIWHDGRCRFFCRSGSGRWFSFSGEVYPGRRIDRWFSNCRSNRRCHRSGRWWWGWSMMSRSFL